MNLALTGLCLSMLLASLGISSANVALPTLARQFDATFQTAAWVVLAYLLVSTSSIVGVGRLGDLIGRRRLLRAGLGLFTAASVLGGFAPTLWLVILARAAQGLGAAAVMALTIAFVSELVPQAKTGSAMGLLGTTSAIGTALGPSLGGALIEQLGWQAIFLVNVPLGLIAVFLAHRYLPVDRLDPKATRLEFDSVGTLLLALTLVAYALAMTLGRGHFGRLNVALLMLAALGVGLFLRAEKRASAPLLRLTMFRDLTLSAALAANLLVGAVMMATLVIGPFYLSRALGLDAGQVGLVMSLGPTLAALTGAPAGRFVDRWGAHRMSLVGLAGIAVGSSLLFFGREALGVPGYVLPIGIITIHSALFQSANNTGVMSQVSPNQRGVVSATLSLSRNLGLITGTSVMGALFALASGTHDIASAPRESVAAGLRITFAVAAALIGVALAAVALAHRFSARATSEADVRLARDRS